MVNSMTGFGRSLLSRDGREITVELKSVNHRYLHVSFRMPRHVAIWTSTYFTGTPGKMPDRYP